MFAALLNAADGTAGVITNQASASFIDGSSKPHTALSNVDSLTTAQAVNVAVSKSFSAADTAAGPGPYTVSLSYSNAGSASAVNVVISDPLPAGLVYVAGSGRWSVTGNLALSDAVGSPDDQGAAPNTIRYDYAVSAPFTVTAALAQVPAGGSGSLSFQVMVTASMSGPINNTAAFRYDDGGLTLSGSSNTAVLTALASVPTATLTVSSPIVAPLGTLTYRLTGSNAGATNSMPAAIMVDGVAAAGILLRDVLPSGTTFSAWGALQPGSVALYHLSGAAPQSYVSVAPAALSTVDAVALLVPALAAGAQFSASFSVTVDGSDTQNGAVQISNTGAIVYATATIPLASSPTNTVVTMVTTSNDSIQFFGPGYKNSQSQAAIGTLLYIQATAPACDSNPTVRELVKVELANTSGDRETFTSTETGPNSGVYQVAPILTSLGTVVVGDGVVEAAGGDTLTVEITSCGAKMTASIILIDPSGVVFDSHSNLPLANAAVSLVVATPNACTATPATVSQSVDGVIQPASSTYVTDATGAYHFPLVPPGNYCLIAVPPPAYAFPSTVSATKQPAGRRVISTSPTSGPSYGGVFAVTAATGPVSVDLPMDARALTGLFVQKTPSKSIAEVGDFVDYTVSIANNTGVALAAAGNLADALPAGFTYVPGSARLNSTVTPDPQGGRGPTLTFHLPALAAASTTLLTYRVQLGSAAVRGDGVNRAQVRIAATVSNLASATVRVEGGVFSDDAFILGKVFLDCNNNQRQDDGEMGIPGVRLYLEDGTNVVTDSEGKYSLYGITAKTHVLKLDRTTLPRDAQLEILSNRNAGDAGSVFADLRNGELHRSDFAVSSCNLKTIDVVSARRKQSEKQASSAAEKLLAAHLDADSSVKPLSDVRGLPASGVVGTAAPVAQSAGSVPLQPVRDIGGFNSLSNDAAKAAPAVTGLPLPQVQVAAPPDLESLLPQLDNQLGFIGLKDHDTLPIAQTNVRIKGTAGSSFVLSVNGEIISDAHVGKKSVLSEKSLQAWEYFGVDLHPGSNHLQVSQIDQFGNARGQAAIDVIAPDKLGKIETLVVQESVADGHGAARILVRLTDAKGTPVTVRTSLTLEATLGSWDVEDLDPREPGVQVFIEGGSREFKLLAPQEPGESAIRVSAGPLQGTAHVTFLPDLRPLIASGLLEGVLNLRSFNTNALTPAQRQDGFEQQLTNLSLNWNTGKEEAAARAAIFLKGKIRGDYLLTLGYDSDKDTQTRLFRDIQPDQFYPVYGDSSVRGFDAQSTSRLYVRIDKGRSWLLYGDFTTQASSDARQLSNYNRSLTGVKEHYETRRLIVNGFASSDSTTQVIDEIKADGTSGPFMLSTPNMVENSERVEVLVRDRNQPALIILVTQLQRFVDYELEPLTGTLLLKAPIATFDPGFNPQSIRITYEVDQAGKKFWVVGADAQYKLNNRLEVGGVFVDDRNPANPGKLEGVNSTLKLGQKTFLTTEVAQTDSAQIGAGTGERVELKHDDGALQARLYADKTDLTFDNPSSSVTPGHTEAGGRVVYKLSDTVSLRGEAVHSEDQATTGQLNGAFVSAEKRLKHGIKVEIGARKAHQNEQGAAAAAAGTPAMTTTNTSTLPPPAVAASGVAPTVPPVDLESLRIKISAPLPYVPKAGIYGEYEQDVRDSDKKLAALGGEYQIATRARVYFRDEVISSLSGPDSLSSVQKQNATMFGVDSDYMKDGRVFSEYRIRDAYSGGEAEAAIGLRNRWPVAPGLTLTTTAERVHTLSGIATEEATAGSLGVDYTANAAWKSSGRIEIRNATDSDSVLVTLGSALKIDADWTALTREALADSRLTGDASGDRKQERLQAGVAFRDTRTNSWSALGLLEHRYEVDTTQPTALLRERTEILSLSGNLQMGVPSVLTLRLAGKWVTDDSNGLPSFAATQLLSARYTRDLTRRWDLGITASTLFNGSLNSHELGLGFEGGYNLAANLWLSAGYNIFGYREDVLSGGDYSNSGVYLRIRFKFDENLLAEATGGFNKPITRPVSGTPP